LIITPYFHWAFSRIFSFHLFIFICRHFISDIIDYFHIFYITFAYDYCFHGFFLEPFSLVISDIYIFIDIYCAMTLLLFHYILLRHYFLIYLRHWFSSYIFCHIYWIYFHLYLLFTNILLLIFTLRFHIYQFHIIEYIYFWYIDFIFITFILFVYWLFDLHWLYFSYAIILRYYYLHYAYLLLLFAGIYCRHYHYAFLFVTSFYISLLIEYIWLHLLTPYISSDIFSFHIRRVAPVQRLAISYVLWLVFVILKAFFAIYVASIAVGLLYVAAEDMLPSIYALIIIISYHLLIARLVRWSLMLHHAHY